MPSMPRRRPTPIELAQRRAERAYRLAMRSASKDDARELVKAG